MRGAVRLRPIGRFTGEIPEGTLHLIKRSGKYVPGLPNQQGNTSGGLEPLKWGVTS